VPISWKKVAIAYFYNTIKSIVKQVVGGLAGGLATLPDDLIMAIIGYIVMEKTQYREEGEALLLASVSSLGATTGLGILGLFGGGGRTVTTQPAPTPTQQQIQVIA
jgi:hypothetical protein